MTAGTRRAWRDLSLGLQGWRIWLMLGISDVRQRYARSTLGPFWITLSMGVFVIAIGIVNATLFRQDVAVFLPLLATNFVVWTLLSTLATEAATVFTQADSFLRQAPLPRSVFVARVIVRALIAFGHNVLLAPVVLLACGAGLSATWALVPLGLLLVVLAAFPLVLVLGILCTRFRDLPNMVQSVVQIAFFLTPVMWPVAALPAERRWFVDWNPLAALMHVLAEPMRGVVPSAGTYTMAAVLGLALWAVALPLFVRFRARLVYWL